MEIALPEPSSAEDVEQALRRVGGEQGVDVSIRELDRDAL
jgi:hypothetical protein